MNVLNWRKVVPDAGESWFDGEKAPDEEWETNHLNDDSS